jgi:hypothetical protein
VRWKWKSRSIAICFVSKKTYIVEKKYNIFPNVSKDLHEFNKKIETIGEPAEVVPTHLSIDQVTQDKIYYRGKSRVFKHVGNFT